MIKKGKIRTIKHNICMQAMYNEYGYNIIMYYMILMHVYKGISLYYYV